MRTGRDRIIPHAGRGAGRPCGGFTLVEVVVSLAILSLIMVATVAALRTFGNTQGAVDTMTSRVDDIRSVSRFLRDTLDGAVVASEQGGTLSLGPGSNVRPPPYFRGAADFVAWKAPIMFGEAYGGVFLVRVAREGEQLVLRWREPAGKTDEEDIAWAEAPSRILLDELETLELAYQGEFDQPWQTVWDEEGSPALVRMTIRAGGRFWPELVLRVQR